MTDAENYEQAAVSKIKAKRELGLHAVIFVLANIIFVVGWAMTGAGYFWPIWPSVGWGMGLAFHGWSVHFGTPDLRGRNPPRIGKGPRLGANKSRDPSATKLIGRRRELWRVFDNSVAVLLQPVGVA